MEEAKVMMNQYKLGIEQNFKLPNVEEHGIVMDLLKSKLQSYIDSSGFKDGSFVKLSSRSAKDATVGSEKTFNIYRELISKVSNPTDNDRLIAINRAHILALRMTSANEIIQIFTSSERIYDDLSLAFEEPDRWNQHFIFREFVEIPIEFEFRAFIVENQLKCMCQYYHIIFFPILVEKKRRIGKINHRKI